MYLFAQPPAPDTAIDLAGSLRSVRHHWHKLLCPSHLLNVIPASTVISSAIKVKVPTSGTASSSNNKPVEGLTNNLQPHSNNRKGDVQSVWGQQVADKNPNSVSKLDFVAPTAPRKIANTNASKCKKMMTAHGILPGFSWGTLSILKQR